MQQDEIAVVAAPVGEIDALRSQAMGRAANRYLAVARIRALLLDLSAADYLDEEAVAWLLGLWRDASRRGVRLAVAGARPVVAQKLTRLGLHTLLSVYEDVAAARSALLAADAPARAR
ncbi:MAG TPA: STAS domain-containing protein [Armatimonadaceae bacterium]|nr:STAS domain-containing protein [Armatimonadaceae bacterium]